MRTVIKMGVAAVVASLVVAAVVAQGGSMNKPLARFTIGDLFPKMVPGLRETSGSWKTASEGAGALASAQLKNIREAMPPVKAALDEAKKESKAAEKNKDFEAAGTAQGKAKSQETVLDVLQRLEKVASTQADLAEAWVKAGEAMKKFADADDAFDKHRGSGIARPEGGERDTRLDQAGYDAFKSRAQALRELGEAYYRMSVKVRDLGDGQLKFASDLEKGGHIRK